MTLHMVLGNEDAGDYGQNDVIVIYNMAEHTVRVLAIKPEQDYFPSMGETAWVLFCNGTPIEIWEVNELLGKMARHLAIMANYTQKKKVQGCTLYTVNGLGIRARGMIATMVNRFNEEHYNME